ncbi:uncharacterized protein AB675_369 [Cyphellophora attinorum]|uniref:Uncharacterized protein n=1 Tax=Cyphellophora attinorum TaxID=1664694 RepID=A0A0N0NS74_9EURO|nr:uncharacterized protein AB675_369 [Phialophora attinorum]KPI45928.1 hypothetical protein AB675_369 [Phialophora attinorum]
MATTQVASTETSPCLLARLMKLYLPQRLAWNVLFKLCLILTSREVVVGTVDAASTFAPDLETSAAFQTVYFQRFDVDPFLTAVLHDQNLSLASKPFVELYPFVCRFANQSPPERMLAISTSFSNRGSFTMMACIMAAAMVVGVVCGVLYGLETGLNVFVAVTGSTAVFQGCLFLISRT